MATTATQLGRGPRAASGATVPRAVRRKRLLIAIADHSVLIALAIAFLAPFVFIVLTALMTNQQALTPKLWPQPFALRQLRQGVRRGADAALRRATPSSTRRWRRSACSSRASPSPMRWRACAGAGATSSSCCVLVSMMLPPQVTIDPAVRDVLQAPPGRDDLAAGHPELVRRRVLDLPAAPVLPDDPPRVRRRRAGRRLRRVPDHALRSSRGWPSPRSPRWRCSASCSAGTTSSARCCTRSRTRPTGRCRWASRSSATCTPCNGTW